MFSLTVVIAIINWILTAVLFTSLSENSGMMNSSIKYLSNPKPLVTQSCIQCLNHSGSSLGQRDITQSLYGFCQEKTKYGGSQASTQSQSPL